MTPPAAPEGTNRFASALSRHPIPAQMVGEVAGVVLEALDGQAPDLAVCFASPHLVGAMEDLAPALRDLLHSRVTIGATTVAVIGGAQEIEEGPALGLFAAVLPTADLTPVTLDVTAGSDGPVLTGWPPVLDEVDEPTLLLFADPYSFPIDAFLAEVAADWPGLRVVGGMASAAVRPGGDRLVLGATTRTTGAVGVLIDGADVRTIVSQGCRPIGHPYVVTRAEGRMIEELGGRTPLARLRECADSADEEERELLRAGIHAGVVIDERQVDFGPGDFLVRGVLGVDPDSEAMAIDQTVGVGQTIQFHVRDAVTADEDLRVLLRGEQAAGALMFACNGRGRSLFNIPDHDAALVQDLLGPLPLAGGFFAGEVGPVGGRSFLHTFTASLLLFR